MTKNLMKGITLKVKRIFFLTFILLVVTACAPGSPVVTATATATAQTIAATATSIPLPVTPTWMVGDRGISWAQIDFKSLTPSHVSTEQCWNSMGVDDKGRIYIGFTSTLDDGRGDFAVFRYDPSNGEKLFLGTFLDVVKAAGNFQEGESIPKGHTRMIFADGKMYMATQGFHDFKQEIDTLPTYRGSHLLAYDTTAGTWDDLSASLPGGVVTAHEGIIALNILPEEHLLVGLAHPSSDIVLFDYQTNQLIKVVPGIPWKLGNPLSREMIVTPTGHIYTYRGTEDPKQRNESYPVWVYDIHTNEMKNIGFEMKNGFWNNQTETRDGSKIYINTVNGGLYEFDVATETFKDLGSALPKTDKRAIAYNYTLTLSPDEKNLYYAVTALDGNRGGSAELFSYNIASGEVSFVQQLPLGVYTSGDARDNENIYFAHFGDFNGSWSGDVRLFVLHAPGNP